MSEFKVGQRVELDGRRGTVTRCDGDGDVHVIWDDGVAALLPTLRIRPVGAR